MTTYGKWPENGPGRKLGHILYCIMPLVSGLKCYSMCMQGYTIKPLVTGLKCHSMYVMRYPFKPSVTGLKCHSMYMRVSHLGSLFPCSLQKKACVPLFPQFFPFVPCFSNLLAPYPPHPLDSPLGFFFKISHSD